jgi:hypothetical protein
VARLDLSLKNHNVAAACCFAPPVTVKNYTGRTHSRGVVMSTCGWRCLKWLAGPVTRSLRVQLDSPNARYR